MIYIFIAIACIFLVGMMILFVRREDRPVPRIVRSEAVDRKGLSPFSIIPPACADQAFHRTSYCFFSNDIFGYGGNKGLKCHSTKMWLAVLWYFIPSKERHRFLLSSVDISPRYLHFWYRIRAIYQDRDGNVYNLPLHHFRTWQLMEDVEEEREGEPSFLGFQWIAKDELSWPEGTWWEDRADEILDEEWDAFSDAVSEDAARKRRVVRE